MENRQEKSWFARNWGWLLGGGCFVLILIVALGIGSLIFGVSKMFTSSTPYKYAMEQATSNQDVIDLIGSPIETDGIMQGNINLSGDDGEADFKIPIKGSKGKGRIVVVATKDYGKWTYEKLYVQIKDSEEQINLLDKVLEGN